MSKKRLLPPLMVAVTILILLTLLAACDGKDSTPAPTTAPPATAEPPLVVTRMVTFTPTFTPQPTPTLPYDLVPVAGRWVMFFDLTITGSDFVDQFRYDGSADLLVSLDGSVRGNGHFSANLLDPICATQVGSGSVLTFTATGRTYEENEQIWVEVTLMPDTPEQPENYAVTCTEFSDITTTNEPMLWPMLTTLDRLSWRFMLETTQEVTFESNLAQVFTSPLNGHLNAIVWIEHY